MTKIARVLEMAPREWKIERIGFAGDLAVIVDGFTYATLHYDYRFTHNAGQYADARAIVAWHWHDGDRLTVDGVAQAQP